MKFIIQFPDSALFEHIKKTYITGIPPFEKSEKLNHVILYTDNKNYYAYKYQPFPQEVYYILPIKTIEQLNMVFAWCDLGMLFEEIKDCLEKPL